MNDNISPYEARLEISEDWLLKKANTFTFATLCSLVGLNPAFRPLQPDHVKSVRRKLLLEFHPDKCKSPSASEHFMFYKDCLDTIETKIESFQFQESHFPKPSVPSPRGKNKSPRFTNSRFKSATTNMSSSKTNNLSPEEFKVFLDQMRSREQQKNKDAYQYRSQDETANGYTSSSSNSSSRKVRSAADVNDYFTQYHQNKQQHSAYTKQQMAEETERRFADYAVPEDAEPNNKAKFSNEQFEKMIRQTETQTSTRQPQRVKPMSLLSSSSSTRLNQGHSLFESFVGSENENQETSMSLSGFGTRLRDAHDPRKHLISARSSTKPPPVRTAKEFEQARSENLFQHATSKQEQEEYLQQQEQERLLRHQSRLYRLYQEYDDTK